MHIAGAGNLASATRQSVPTHLQFQFAGHSPATLDNTDLEPGTWKILTMPDTMADSKGAQEAARAEGEAGVRAGRLAGWQAGKGAGCGQEAGRGEWA